MAVDGQATWGEIKRIADEFGVMTRTSRNVYGELYEDAVIDLADKFVADAACAFALAED